MAKAEPQSIIPIERMATRIYLIWEVNVIRRRLSCLGVGPPALLPIQLALVLSFGSPNGKPAVTGSQEGGRHNVGLLAVYRHDDLDFSTARKQARHRANVELI